MSDENEDTHDEGGKRVPYWRFQEVVAERKAWQEKAAKAEANYVQAQEKLGQWDAVVKERDEWKARSEQREQMFATDLRLAEAGFDADAREIARMLHGRLPEKDRPDVVDWVGGFRADPSKAPRALQAYLPRDAGKSEAEGKGAGKAPDAGKGEAEGKGTGGFPRSTPAAQPGGAPAGGTGPTAEAIAAATREAQRTGDWRPYNTLLGRPPDWRPGKG